MAKEEKEKRSYLNMKDAFTVKEKLDEVLVKHDDGTCSYIGIDDDDSIAASFDFKCTKANVVNVRKQFFGELARTKTSTQDLKDRLAAVERDLADLRKLYNNLGERFEPKQENFGQMNT